MNRTASLAALALTAALGLFVGVWAFALPDTFYSTFPGVLGSWVSVDGPFNEHLIRDVGALYLALAAASASALVWPSPAATRVVGVAWTVFGALHLAYHLTHLHHAGPPASAVGSVTALTLSLALGVVLVIPPRTRKESTS